MSDLLGASLDTLNNSLTNLANAQNVRNTNKTNASIAESTNNANMSMNRENIAYQRETNDLNYIRQQAENALTRLREDTAYSRAASDLEGAGLSKTLAAGNPASSANIQIAQATAPENKFQMQRYENKAFQAEAIKTDLDILSSMQKIKNLEYQDMYNDFFEKYHLLPGTSNLFNLGLGLRAIGVSLPEFFNNLATGLAPETVAESIPTTTSVASPSYESIPESSPLPASSKGHSRVSVPSFTRSMLNDLDLEPVTKKALSNTSADSSNFISSWLAQGSSNKNTWSFPVASASQSDSSNSKPVLPSAYKLKNMKIDDVLKRYGSVALLSILGTGGANLKSYLDDLSLNGYHFW